MESKNDYTSITFFILQKLQNYKKYKSTFLWRNFKQVFLNKIDNEF